MRLRFFSLTLFLIVASIAVAGCKPKTAPTPGTSQAACPNETQACPDGSVVRRLPPSCEFSACPPPVNNAGVASCPKDLKVCPNGAQVSRQGPNCEFADCPAVAKPVVCPKDTLTCPGGYILYRQGADCQFPACPRFRTTPEYLNPEQPR